MKMNTRLCAVALTSLLSSSTLCAASPDKPALKDVLQKSADDYFNEYAKKEMFTAIAVSAFIPHGQHNEPEDTTTVVAGTMGHPPYNQLITKDDLFDIGSITKSFTALILLQLQAEGKLSLDDPLGKWLPQYVEWKEVTLRRLLNMTSGIPNYSEDPEFSQKMMDDFARVWTDQELIEHAHPENPIEYKENNPFDYSNTNYILAGLVIEKVTQDTFENQLQKRIINENLHHSYYPAGPSGTEVQKAIESRKLHNYFYDEDTKILYDTFNNSLSWAGAAGAIVANTEDVVRWVQLLYHGTLFQPEHRERALAELESVVSMKTGLPIPNVTAKDPSAFGLGVGYHYDEQSKQRFWTYQGSTLGFRVMYMWNPCNEVITVVALNSKGGEGKDSSELGNQITAENIKLYHSIIDLYPDLQCASD